MPSGKEKLKKRVRRPSEMVSFKWGGRTQEWEEESEQIMNTLQDQIDDRETNEELERKIEYGTRRQYW